MKQLRIRLLAVGLQLWLCILNLLGSHDQYTPAARSAGMGGVCVMLPGFWSVQQNQAGLAWLEHPQAGFHHETRFMISQLGMQTVALAFPVRPGTLGFNYSRFGYAAYHESRWGLSFGRKFGNQFSAGIQLNYFQTEIGGNYGKQGRLGFEAGIQYRPSDKIQTGVHVFNPAGTGLTSETKDPLPTRIRLGVAFHLSEALLLGLEAEKELEQLPVWKAGLEYHPLEKLWIRAGLADNPVRYCFGLGYAFGKIRLDMAFSHHQSLGISPHLSLLLRLN